MGFYTVQVLTGLSSAATLFLVAAGLSLIFGVTRVVNFAHGSLYMLGAYLALTLVDLLGRGQLAFWSAVLLAALGVGLIGVAVEVLILRRIYKAPELFQLLATFGVILVVQDLALWLWGAQDQAGPRVPGLRGSVPILDQRLPRYDLVLIAAAPMVLGTLWLLFARTRWGILVRAATADREMVGALGVNQAWLFTSVFFVGACLAGFAGAIQTPKGGANLLMDLNIIAAAFVVVVVGGMGSLMGAFLASLLIGQLQAFGILFLPQATLVLMFLVMAVVLSVRPWGLLGRPEGQSTVSALDETPLRPAPPRLRLLGAVVLVALLALPLVADGYTLVLAVELLILALFAASLHLIMGPGGLVSFGHAAYFGGGAYTAALAVHWLGWPMEVVLPLAPLGAALLALVFGWFCVRLRGVYFAMLTLAAAQIAWSTAVQWTSVTRRRRRAARHLALGLGQRPSGLLLPHPGPGHGRLPVPAPCRLHAVRLGPARRPRQPLARRGRRHRHAHPAMAGLRPGRRLRRAGRRPLRLLQGQRVPRRDGNRPLVRRAHDGAHGRRAHARGPAPRRGRLRRDRGCALPAHLLAAPPRLDHHPDRAGLPARSRRLPAHPLRPRLRPRRRRARMTVLQARGLVRRFSGFTAVAGVDLHVAEREMLALIGPNGAGKTTCFNLLMGQLSPDAGRLELLGHDVTGWPPRRIWRLGVGRTFQITATLPSFTVAENVQLAILSHERRLKHILGAAGRHHRAASLELLDRVGMADRADSACALLAYGDLKRLELAIALAHGPRLLLMDEPTAGMAPAERRQLMTLVRGLRDTDGLSVLFTEHDMDMVFGFADRVVVMSRGRIVADGPPEQVRADPEVQAIYLGTSLAL